MVKSSSLKGQAVRRGSLFLFVHQSSLPSLSFVYRLSATALSRGLGGQTLRSSL
nr:MAG TPA: hypothetical protein [Caudoviricetes sp.]